MRHLFLIVLSAAFVYFGNVYSQTTSAGDFSESKYAEVEANLINGLKSDNLGLQISCAYWLGEIKSQKSVIPLMKMFRSHPDERANIIAALSISKIDDPHGVFLIKRTAELSDNSRLKRVFERFYVGNLNMKVDEGVEQEEVRYAVEKADNFLRCFF